MFPRWAGRVVAVAAAVALAAACSHSDVQYISVSSGGLFVKLPKSWGVFDVHTGTVGPALKDVTGEWKVIIDGAPEPQRSHAEATSPADPIGFVEVIPTALFSDPSGIDTHVGLRSLTFGGKDPIDAARTDQSMEIVKYQEVELSNGFWGNVLTLRATNPDDGEQQTITQLAYADTSFERVYVLRVACTTECYEANADEIQSIIDSWTLRNP